MTGWPHFGPELEPTCGQSWIGVHNPYWGILIPPLIPINIPTTFGILYDGGMTLAHNF